MFCYPRNLFAIILQHTFQLLMLLLCLTNHINLQNNINILVRKTFALKNCSMEKLYIYFLCHIYVIICNILRGISFTLTSYTYTHLHHHVKLSFIYLFKLLSILLLFFLIIPNKFSNTLISMTHILG